MRPHPPRPPKPAPPTWAALALALAAGCGGSAPAERPNVLLISIDSLRRDHLGVYGHRNSLRPDVLTSPALDALGAEGVVFENAVSTTSWTLPSHMALMTGLPDRLHGVVFNDFALAPGFTTLAEFLSERGYATGGFFSGPNLNPIFGFIQGFDHYEDCSNIAQPLEDFTGEPGDMQDVHADSHQAITSRLLLERSTAWIREHAAGEKPFFAFVHWWDPHYDYIAPEPYVDLFDPDYVGRMRGVHKRDRLGHWNDRDLQHLEALYDAEIRFTDEHVGKLFALLDELGIADDTIVAVVADHGEEFYEHGRWGHQRTLFDEVVRIPMIMRWPGHVPARVRPNGQARIQDVYPTIAALVDYAPPDYLEGQPLVPLWEDPEHPGHPQHLKLDVAPREVDLVGLRWGDRKVIADRHTGTATVYDISHPSGEKVVRTIKNFMQSDAKAAVELQDAIRELNQHAKRLPDKLGHRAELSDQLLRELQNAGYVGVDEDEDDMTDAGDADRDEAVPVADDEDPGTLPSGGC